MPRRCFIRRRGRALAAAFCSGALALAFAPAAPVTLPVSLRDGNNYLWDITADGRIANGTDDAFDGGFRLAGFPSQSQGQSEDDGREITLGPATVGGVQVTRKIYVPAEQGYARFLEIVSNPGVAPIEFRVQIATDLGSDNDTQVAATASGDTALGPDDDWVVTDDADGAGDPAVTHVVAGPGGRVRPAVFRSPNVGTVAYEYVLRLAPRTTSAVLHFGVQTPTRSLAVSRARLLAQLPVHALAGMDAIERAAVVNFPMDGLVVEPAGPFAAIGPEGGPFLPSNALYRVVNATADPMAWSVSWTSDWAVVEPLAGQLPAGATAAVRVAVAPPAAALSMGPRHCALVFSNGLSGLTQVRDLALVVAGPGGLLLREGFESGAPAWTRSGDWQVGRPLSGPCGGYTSACVAATQLAADYGDGTLSRLISPAVYLPLPTHPKSRLALSYRQWLDTEPDLDVATFALSGDAGQTWTPLKSWSGAHAGWSTVEVDLTGHGGSVARLLFELASDESVRRAGWYVDDVEIRFLRPAPLDVSVISLDSLNFPYVYMNVLVETNGASINSLGQTNFTVYEDGVLQTESFEVLRPSEGGGSRLCDIVFLMDNSGSMSDDQDAVARNVTNFVDRLVQAGIHFAFGLCRYGQNQNGGRPIIEDAGVLTTDSEYFRNDVWRRNESSGGHEPGYEAIVQALDSFIFRPGAQKVLIVITDETPNQGDIAREEDAIAAAVGVGAVVFALTEDTLFKDFEGVTEAAGGGIFDIASPFDSIFDAISAFLAQSYLVRYRSTDANAGPRRRRVEVHVRHGADAAFGLYAYVPRSTPKIDRTDATLALHRAALSNGVAPRIEARIVDHVAPYTQSARLFWRNTTNAFFTPTPMSNTVGDLWEARIPAQAVRPPGVDYFIVATDGETSSSDPSSQPNENGYQFAVLPNRAPEITHTPLLMPTPYRPLTVTATATDQTAGIDRILLRYRRTGQLLYRTTLMTNGPGPLFWAVIPTNDVTTEGIEYTLHARDDQGVGQYHGTPDKPHRTFVARFDVTPRSVREGLFTGGTATQSLFVASGIGGTGPLVFEPMPGTNGPRGVLSFDPVVGYLPQPGSQGTLRVVFDASGLDSGVYPLDFDVASSDPNRPRVPIQATLTVTGAADIALSASRLDFGGAFLGTIHTQALRVVNAGFAALNVAHIRTDHPAYSNDAAGFTLPPGATQTVAVVLAPQAVGPATGTLFLTSNDPYSPVIGLPLAADILPPPRMTAAPREIAVTNPAGARVQIPFAIGNMAGGSALQYSLRIAFSNAPPGYTRTDSDQPGGPSFDWFDVAGSGAALGPLGDGGWATVQLPFPFVFFGKVRTNLLVSANGHLTFGPGGDYSYNDSIPDPDAPNDLIAPFWDNLAQQLGACHAYHDAAAGRFIVQYTAWGNQTSVARYDFQVHLYASGDLSFQYRSMDGDTRSATVGIENGNGTQGLRIAWNAPYVHDGLAVRLSPFRGFADLDGYRGIVPAGTSAVRRLTIDAGDLPAGTYTARLDLVGNDPSTPFIAVPLRLEVAGSPDIALAGAPLDFGVTYVGASYTNWLRVLNRGAAVLHVSDVASDNPEFAPPAGPIAVAPRSERYVPVAFHPSATGRVAGVVTIASDDPDEPLARAELRADRWAPPMLRVATNAIRVRAPPNAVVTNALVLDNAGGAGPLRLTAAIRRPAAAAGYTWQRSDGPGAAGFDWFDISKVGIPSGLGDTQSTVDMNLPFAFPFFGEPQNTVRLARAGYLTFGAHSSYSGNSRIPLPTAPNALIAAFWDDLAQRAGEARTWHDALRHRFIAQYSNWGRSYGNGQYTFQARMYSSGDIELRYLTMTGELANATVGIENGMGLEGAQIAFNSNLVQGGFGVDILAPREFLRVVPDAGSVATGAVLRLDLVADTRGLRTPTHTAELVLDTNDPRQPRVRVPVQLDIETAPDVDVVPGPLMDFGPAFVGYPTTGTIHLVNRGVEILAVHGITASGPELVPAVPGVSLRPGQFADVPLVFTPAASGATTVLVSLASNDPDEPVFTLNARIDAAERPRLAVGTDTVVAEATAGRLTTNVLTVANERGSPLSFRVWIESRPGEAEPGAYSWADSDAAHGPAFEWFDISRRGVDTGLRGDDTDVQVALPFPFPFFGKTNTRMRISSNGYLTFGDNGASTSNQRVPDSGAPNDLIALLWDDLHSRSGTNYLYHDAARERLVIQYHDWGAYGDATAKYRFQAQLFASGDILLLYHSLTGRLNSATVGIEDAGGTNGLLAVCNGPYLRDRLAVRFSASHPFVRVTPSSGTLAAGQRQDLLLVFDPARAASDVEWAWLALRSNDPARPEVRVPLCLRRGGPAHGLGYSPWVSYYWPGGDGGGPAHDFDRDGADNWTEWVCGTDPIVAASRLAAAGNRMSPDAISILRWPSVSNRAYAVEWTTNLASGFGVLASNLPATPAENVYTDAVNRAASQGFYRIRATR